MAAPQLPPPCPEPGVPAQPGFAVPPRDPEIDLGVNILLVDDQPANLLALEAVLAAPGRNLMKAHSGREALRCLLNDDVALILMDVMMPEMDGFETAALIHQR